MIVQGRQKRLATWILLTVFNTVGNKNWTPHKKIGKSNKIGLQLNTIFYKKKQKKAKFCNFFQSFTIFSKVFQLFPPFWGVNTIFSKI